MSRSCVTRAAQTSTRVVTTDSLFLSDRAAYVTYPASRKALIITLQCFPLGTGQCGPPIEATTYITYPGSTATSWVTVTITSHYYATYVTTFTTTSCTTVSTRPPSSQPPSSRPLSSSRSPSTSPIYNPPSSSQPPSSSRPPSTSPIYNPPSSSRRPPPTTVISTVVVPPPTPNTSNLLSTGSPSATSALSSDFSTSFDTPTSSSRPQVTVSRLDATEPTDSFSSPTIGAFPAATTTSSSRIVAHAVGYGVGGLGAAVLLGLVFYHFILPKVGSLFGLKAAKSVALHRVVREPDFDNDLNQDDQTENGQGNIQMQDIQTTRRGPTQNAYHLRHNHQGLNYPRPNRVTMPQVAGVYPSGSSWSTNTWATGYPGGVPVDAAGHNIEPVSYTTFPDSSRTSAVQNGLHRHQSGSPDSAQLAMMRSMSLFPGQYTGYAEPLG